MAEGKHIWVSELDSLKTTCMVWEDFLLNRKNIWMH